MVVVVVDEGACVQGWGLLLLGLGATEGCVRTELVHALLLA